jgi:SAM-dependent methyltransferase
VDFAAVRDWPGYYRVMLGKPPRETLVEALDRFDREGSAAADGGRRAVDLGCGEGRDTLELLRRGWRVLAIDDHPEAARLLAGRVPVDQRPRLEMRTAPFHAMDWSGVDLVNASFALPFCAPGLFPALWSAIVGSIRPGGRFAGQFFGDRDSWAELPDRTHLTEAEVRTLLAAFDVETFRIDERDDADARGAPKHWHVFHVVARKR